jgi:hypothetical protein
MISNKQTLTKVAIGKGMLTNSHWLSWDC